MVRPRQFKDEDILAVARACFIEHGPAVPTTLIAESAGVSQATLFKRFGTKQELMRESLRPRVAPQLLAQLADGPDERPIPDQLLALVTGLTAMFEALLPCVMTLWAAGEHPGTVMGVGGDALPVKARRALTQFLHIAQSQRRMAGGDPEAMAMVLIGSAKELAFQRNMFPESAPTLTSEAYGSALVESFWLGCAPPETS
jgi:AcrR family transcriptional regulator